MKKAKPNDRPSSGSSSSSKSGSERPNTPRKVSAPEKGSKPLTKSLSKSHDNLASQLRRKAAQANLASIKDPGRVGSPAVGKFKTPKNPATPIRKAQSTPSIDNSTTPIKRTQSEQNISNTTPKRPNTAEAKNSAVKRASSSHNVSSPKTPARQTRATTQVSAMAYNAELLASFEKEKKALERRISELIQTGEERKAEIEKLKFHVKNLQERIPEGDLATELTSLRTENNALKSKLCELGVRLDPYTDSEKLSLLRQANGHRDDCDGVCDSVSLSGAKTSGSHDLGAELVTPESERIGFCSSDLGYAASALSMDPNWDKHSNKSSDAMSEVSVACLQDRILQMEETHYSTNEELQATLQELGDLQDAVNELTCENESLADEKSVLLESLCAQTEKLENARLQIEHLKVLLVTDSDDHNRSENERQLMGLIKSAQEEKEELLLKQMEYGNVLHSLETENRELQDVVTALRDKTRILDMKNESLSSDKRANENLVTELREQAMKDQIEMQRYKTLLEHEKQKATELEQERNATDKSDLEELLDGLRVEKEKLEERFASLQEQLAVSQNEVLRHKENISSLEEEIKVCKNNAKTEVSLFIRLQCCDIEFISHSG
jgi:DNA repair exonuclease SbcCD ATPase subunit